MELSFRWRWLLVVYTRLQGPFERSLVQTCTSKNEIPAYKAVLHTKDIVCLQVNNSHVAFFFLVDPSVYGHWRAAPQMVLPKLFRKGCLGYAKFDTLKLWCELKLPQSIGNQFTTWKNKMGGCLRGILYIFLEGTVVTFFVSGLLTPKLKC